MMRSRTVLVLALLSPMVFGCGPEPTVTDAQSLVRSMHDRYADHRPGSLTLVQQTVQHAGRTVPDTMIWYEAAIPGKLRIDMAPVDSGNGALWSDGQFVAARRGQIALRRPEVNPLQLILMDLYQFEPDRTLLMLDTLGFDLSQLRSATWDGREAWVVGAAEDDTTSAQFWVDRDRLVPVRVIVPVGGGTSTWDTRVTGFREQSGYFQEDRLDMYIDGWLYQQEIYTSIRAGVEVDPALFDTTVWTPASTYWE